MFFHIASLASLNGLPNIYGAVMFTKVLLHLTQQNFNVPLRTAPLICGVSSHRLGNAAWH